MSRIVPATFAMTIAIVGEEPAVAEVLARLLARELPSAQIMSITSVADLPPTLILTLTFVRASDFHRQGFTDIWMMRQRAPTCAIIVTCTSLSPIDADYAKICGATAILHKPFARASLQAVLGQVLPDAETDGRYDGVGPPPRAVYVSGDSPDTACNALVRAGVYSGSKTWERHHTASCGAAPTCCVRCAVSICVPAPCPVHRVTV